MRIFLISILISIFSIGFGQTPYTIISDTTIIRAFDAAGEFKLENATRGDSILNEEYNKYSTYIDYIREAYKMVLTNIGDGETNFKETFLGTYVCYDSAGAGIVCNQIFAPTEAYIFTGTDGLGNPVFRKIPSTEEDTLDFYIDHDIDWAYNYFIDSNLDNSGSINVTLFHQVGTWDSTVEAKTKFDSVLVRFTGSELKRIEELQNFGSHPTKFWWYNRNDYKRNLGAYDDMEFPVYSYEFFESTDPPKPAQSDSYPTYTVGDSLPPSGTSEFDGTYWDFENVENIDDSSGVAESFIRLVPNEIGNSKNIYIKHSHQKTSLWYGVPVYGHIYTKPYKYDNIIADTVGRDNVAITVEGFTPWIDTIDGDQHENGFKPQIQLRYQRGPLTLTNTIGTAEAIGLDPYVAGGSPNWYQPYNPPNFTHIAIYKASELIASGLQAGDVINAMSWNYAVPQEGNPAGVGAPINIEIAHTLATKHECHAWASPSGSYVSVLSSYSPPFPTTGWNLFPFSTGFTWDGTSNILVKTCSDAPTNATNEGYVYIYNDGSSDIVSGSATYGCAGGVNGPTDIFPPKLCLFEFGGGTIGEVYDDRGWNPAAKSVSITGKAENFSKRYLHELNGSLEYMNVNIHGRGGESPGYRGYIDGNGKAANWPTHSWNTRIGNDVGEIDIWNMETVAIGEDCGGFHQGLRDTYFGNHTQTFSNTSAFNTIIGFSVDDNEVDRNEEGNVIFGMRAGFTLPQYNIFEISQSPDLNPPSPRWRLLYGSFTSRWLRIESRFPASQQVRAEVTDDVFVTNNLNGVIIRSPDGTCWRIQSDNTGTLNTTTVACP